MEVFGWQGPIISPTLLTILILKEFNSNDLWCFRVKCNEPQNGVSVTLDEKFRRLQSHPVLAEFNSF
jgi:hypothetical protein